MFGCQYPGKHIPDLLVMLFVNDTTESQQGVLMDRRRNQLPKPGFLTEKGFDPYPSAEITLTKGLRVLVGTN